jgi:perosamine synthetase
MDIPQFQPFIGKEEYDAIKDCFDNNWITEGPKATEFKKKICEAIHTRYGVFAPNGTLALYLGLRALGIGQGDEVIVPDCTFIASANAVEMVGATPIFVDVNRMNFQIEISDCDRVYSEKTRAIMPVHLYGMAVDMNSLMKYANERNLLVIEDAAQALGIRYRDQFCGTFGDIGTFSFFADKTITTGEGGFVVAKNEELYHKLLYLRNQGRLDRGTFIHPEIGYNFRMTDIQMAIGLVQFNKFKIISDRKKAIYDRYRTNLSGISQVKFTTIEPGSEFIPFRVTILCEDAHQLMAHMATKNIQPRTFFYPLHKQPCFQYLRQDEHWLGRCNDQYYPNATYGYEHGICLPSFAALTLEQIDYVCEAIRDYYNHIG